MEQVSTGQPDRESRKYLTRYMFLNVKTTIARKKACGLSEIPRRPEGKGDTGEAAHQAPAGRAMGINEAKIRTRKDIGARRASLTLKTTRHIGTDHGHNHGPRSRFTHV